MVEKVLKVASADQFAAWQIQYAEFARFCNEAARACEKASQLIEAYGRLCQEKQQQALSTGHEESRERLTSLKQEVVEMLLDNVMAQVHNVQELQRLQDCHERYSEELETLQAALSEAEYLYADSDVESYLDILFASDTPAENVTTSDEAQKVEEEHAPREVCVICMDEIPPHTTPLPLSENTAVVRCSSCRQVACRECLEKFWDTNNDNKIACPVCRKIIGDEQAEIF